MKLNDYFKNVPDDEIDVNLVDLFLKRCAAGYEKTGLRLKDYALLYEPTYYSPLREAERRLTLVEFGNTPCEPYLLDAMYYLLMEIMWRRKEQYTEKEVEEEKVREDTDAEG